MKSILKLAEFPFYSTYEDLRTRVLISLCVGCYLHLGGCKNFGSLTLNKHIKNLKLDQANVNKYLTGCAMKKINDSSDVRSAHVNSIMHEPFNQMPSNQ